MIKDLIHRKPVTFSGSLYSPEFKRDFKTERSTAKVEPHPEQRGKLRLMIDGVSDSTWFRNRKSFHIETSKITIGGMVLPVPLTVPARACNVPRRK